MTENGKTANSSTSGNHSGGGAHMHGPGGGRRHGGFQKPKDMRRTIGKLMVYLTRYKILLFIVVILLLTSSLCTVGGSYLLRPLINDYIIPGNFPGLVRMLLFMALVYATGAVCSYGYARIMVQVSQNTIARIREDLFARLQKLPLKYFDSHTHGELMSRFTNDIETISEALNNSFGSLISCTLNFTFTIAAMLLLNPVLTLVTFGMLFIMLLVVREIGGRSRRYFSAQQKTLGEINGYIEEMTEGQKVIKVFHHEQAAKEGFYEKNEAYRQAATRAHMSAGIMMPAMGNLSYINYALTCAVGGLLAVRTNDLGTLAAFLQYSRQVSQPLTQISQQVNTILSAVAGAERVFEIMETEPEVDTGTVTLVHTEDSTGNNSSGWAWKKSDGSLVPLRGDVRFDHVVFGYDPRKTILHDISLYAKPGQKIAFVGSTGAGKTTMTSLMNRFYEIQSGTITFDGIEIGQEIKFVDSDGKSLQNITAPKGWQGTSGADSLENDKDSGLYTVMNGLAGNDTITNHKAGTVDAAVIMEASAGTNYFTNDANYVQITGGTATDNITNSGSYVTINGGEGANKVSLTGGSDIIITGGTGIDSLIVDDGATITADLGIGANKVTLNGGSDISITSGTGNDTFLINDGSNIEITGGAGADAVSVKGGSGIKVTLGTGNDQVSLAAGHSEVEMYYAKGDGTDTIYNITGDDKITIAGYTQTEIDTFTTAVKGTVTTVKAGTANVLILNGYTGTDGDMPGFITFVAKTEDTANARVAEEQITAMDLFEDNNFMTNDAQISDITAITADNYSAGDIETLDLEKVVQSNHATSAAYGKDKK